jgi:exosortase
MSQANPRVSSTAKSLHSRSGFGDFGDMDDSVPLDAASEQRAWMIFGGLLLLLVAAYWDMLTFTSTFWAMDMYSHGYIVPLFAAYLFWIRKKPLMQAEAAERWAGVGLAAVCLAVRTWASYYDYNNPDRWSFLGCLLGICLIVGGVKMLRWAGPALLFLFFMYPFPNVLERTLLMKLQMVASIISTWVLQVLGVSAARYGNTISIDTLKEPLEVAEACSGLRMLTIFGAMCFAMIMIIERPWWDKLVIFLSIVPIALASNIIRIVTTALLSMAFGQETPWVSALVHDWAGLAMMPIGLGLLVIELAILSRITIPIDTEEFGGFSPAPA